MVEGLKIRQGTVIVQDVLLHTKLWPRGEPLNGHSELAYRRALGGRLVTVLDTAVDDSSYLVQCNANGLSFIWDIDIKDTVPGSFVKKVDPAQEFMNLLRRLG
jgi:hypothetical protein